MKTTMTSEEYAASVYRDILRYVDGRPFDTSDVTITLEGDRITGVPAPGDEEMGVEDHSAVLRFDTHNHAVMTVWGHTTKHEHTWEASNEFLRHVLGNRCGYLAEAMGDDGNPTTGPDGFRRALGYVGRRLGLRGMFSLTHDVCDAVDQLVLGGGLESRIEITRRAESAMSSAKNAQYAINRLVQDLERTK